MARPTVERILRIEVPIVVLLGEKSMRLSDVLAMQPGMILELPKRADSELDLHVNNTPVGQGLAVKVGENFGIRLTHIGSVQARINALAPELTEGDHTESGKPSGSETAVESSAAA